MSVQPDHLPHLANIRHIYVSGPMTGLPEFNYPAFRSATAALRGLGFEAYCPTELPSGNGEPLDTTGMTGTERLPANVFNLRDAFANYAAYITQQADAVAVLPGWENSKGAKGEVALAVAIGLPVLDALSLDLIEPMLFAAPSADVDTSTDGLEEDPAEREAALAASMLRHPAGKRRPDLAVVSNPVAATASQSGSGEVRVTSASGGQKGVKEARYDLIPPGPLRELAVLYGRGCMKYDADNWKRGYPWSLSKGALERHFGLFWLGEDYDEEMGVKHLICVAWHAINLAWMLENRTEFDDRPGGQGETYVGALPTPQWLIDLAEQKAAEAGAGQ